LWVCGRCGDSPAESDEAEREIVRLAQERKWKIAVWDIAQGLRLPGASSSSRPESAAGDPLAALRASAGRVNRLTLALKQQRRQSKALRAALASLRGLDAKL
jgi:hypothetical protein